MSLFTWCGASFCSKDWVGNTGRGLDFQIPGSRDLFVTKAQVRETGWWDMSTCFTEAKRGSGAVQCPHIFLIHTSGTPASDKSSYAKEGFELWSFVRGSKTLLSHADVQQEYLRILCLTLKNSKSRPPGLWGLSCLHAWSQQHQLPIKKKDRIF